MKKVGISFFLILLTFVCSCQSVGLVLSGGGAKGMAHLGVIKALEEYDIPIDYITGTSAGAIVGALYASGYSVEQILDIFNSGIMEKYLKTEIEFNSGYLSKELPESAGWFKFKFNVDSTFTFNFLPTSLILSNDLDFGMMEFFAQSTTICEGDFDKLMIKFRSVASSVNDNRKYVFRSGDLDVAVRASMAFPFIFSPVQVDDKVLLDGGMFDNFPVDVMIKDFNPDVILGSSVTSNFSPPDKDDIISVLQNVFMVDVDFTMPDNGLLIETSTTGIELLDFDKVLQIVDSGYNACIEQMPIILDMIDREVSAEERRDMRDQFNNKKQPLFFDSIIVDNLTKPQQQYVEVMMAKKQKLLTPKEISENYSLLLSDDMIASAIPRAVYNDSCGHYDLHLDVKKNMNFLAELGGNLSIGGSSEGYFGFSARGLSRYSWNASINTFFGSFYNSIGLYGRIDFPATTLFYGVVDLAANNKDFRETSYSIINGENPSYLLQSEYHALLQLGLSLAKRSDLSFNMAYFSTTDKYYNTDAFTRNDVADEDIFTGGIIGLKFTNNTLNDRLFPTNGRRFVAQLDNVFGKETYNPGTTSLNSYKEYGSREWIRCKVQYDKYFKLSKSFTLGCKFHGEVSNQPLCVNYTSSLLHSSSFEPFDDAKLRFIEENRSYNFIGGGLNLIMPLPFNFMVKAEGYAFIPFFQITELSNQQVEFGDFYTKTYFMGNISLIFKNKLAPISLNFSFYDSRSTPYAITFNIGYILFNRYALD